MNTCCKICGNHKGNKIFMIKERRINNGEKFQYLYCNHCGTLQLNEDIENIGKYYPDNYYSFHMKKGKNKKILPPTIRKSFVKAITNCSFGIPYGLCNVMRAKAASLMVLYGTKVKINSRILDVGGGNGKWLDSLSEWGFDDLTCIDLFCKESPYSSIKFRQCDIKMLDDRVCYDLITFNHSFEHMPDPEEILHKVKAILSPDGTCLIRIPVCESEAWIRYQENWAQIDAPRHYFLYTERALRRLCVKVGLQIENIVYDSNATQFIVSEYLKNTDFRHSEIVEMAQKQYTSLKEMWKIDRKINKTSKGDQAAFYIKHMPNMG